MGKVACLLALLCGGCAAQAIPKQPYNFDFKSFDVLSVKGKPAGYYPGYVDVPFVDSTTKAWLAQHQPRIDEIQTRISAIREGRIAPGCIGEDQYTCAATLAQKFAIADHMSDESLVAETKYDVNGKPVTGSEFEFEGYVPGPDGVTHDDAVVFPTKFVVKMGRNAKVSTVDVKLPIDPTGARTQDQYDATDAYETVSALTAKDCPALSREDVAKWIENTIKPKIKSYRERVRRGTAEIENSKRTAFCGRTFQFSSAWVSRTYNQYGPNIRGGWALVVE
jgi:hypothetical protein